MNAKDELAYLYGNRCMFTDSKEVITYHHIEKECDGGPRNVENGALLTSISQAWLHNYIENQDPELFNLINECLQLYKICMDSNNVELLKQYRDEVIPLFQEAIIKYDNRINKGKNTKQLVRRRNNG